MQLKHSEFRKIVNKLGMRIREGKDTLAFFEYNGKTILWTKCPHGKIKGKIPDFIRQQFRLKEEQFRDLKNCPLKRQGYIKILKDKQIL